MTFKVNRIIKKYIDYVLSVESTLLKSVCSRNSLEIEKLKSYSSLRSIPLKPATEKGILSSDESLYFSLRKCIFSKLAQYFAHIYC